MKTNSKLSAYILRGSTAALLFSWVIVAICSAINLPKPSPKISAPQNNTALSFADRVAYQSAIEDVYWRHRIWPDTNPSPKPSLDEVMSQAELEKKVENYLRNSQALEDYWQRPITADQLQTEMERMASYTKQPEVLREVFEALGNDPFLIAECLARPILAERLVADPTVVAEPALSASRTGVSPAPRSLFAADTAASTENRFRATNRGVTSYTLPEIASPSGLPAGTPTLGNYPATTVDLSDNITVTPDAAPTGTTSITVSTSTSFNAELTADVATGVVRLTNAQPAKLPPGAYTVTVRAFGPGGSTTRTFMLTVTTPPACAGITFAAASNFTVGMRPVSVAVGDFNGDGVQDLATANWNSNNLSVLIGTGTGSFGPASNFTVGQIPITVAVGDFNGDGVQDLATANSGSSNVSVLIGTGTGSFGPPSNFPVGTEPRSVAVGDFNGDGVQDLAVANLGSNNVSVLIGTGTGSFGPPSNFPVGTWALAVAVGDFNGDGVQDLAAANYASNNVSVLIGTGTGSFGPASNFTVGTNPEWVAVGDFNGDGVQDLAAANENSNNVSVLIGTGTGSFGAASNFTAGANPEWVAVGDFNGDGVQDLATANRTSNNVSVLIGTGTGSFGAASNFPVGANPYSVAVGDFNGDGVQDLAAANSGSDNVSVLLRTCPATPTPTPSPTSTPTATPTVTATATASSTPRSQPTPRPRPTPAPRP